MRSEDFEGRIRDENCHGGTEGDGRAPENPSKLGTRGGDGGGGRAGALSAAAGGPGGSRRLRRGSVLTAHRSAGRTEKVVGRDDGTTDRTDARLLMLLLADRKRWNPAGLLLVAPTAKREDVEGVT